MNSVGCHPSQRSSGALRVTFSLSGLCVSLFDGQSCSRRESIVVALVSAYLLAAGIFLIVTRRIPPPGFVKIFRAFGRSPYKAALQWLVPKAGTVLSQIFRITFFPIESTLRGYFCLKMAWSLAQHMRRWSQYVLWD